MRTTALGLLLALSVPVAARAQQTEAWEKVAPGNEEFVARMPTDTSRREREIPLGEGLTLVRPVYESAGGGLHFMVISFDKWEAVGDPIVLKNFDSFASGFEHAVRRNRHTQGNSLKRDEDFVLRGMKIRPYRVRMGAHEGVARLYEAKEHFYVVMVLGATYGDDRVDRFLKAFTLKTANSASRRQGEADDLDGLMRMVEPPAPAVPVSDQPPPAPPPPGPWPLYRPARPRAPISGGVLNGKMTYRPVPEYPAVARAVQASGTVVVQVMVDVSGKVISATAVSGHPLLRQAAVDAAYKARFAPVKLSGQPVKVTGTITFNFNLDDKPSPIGEGRARAARAFYGG